MSQYTREQLLDKISFLSKIVKLQSNKTVERKEEIIQLISDILNLTKANDDWEKDHLLRAIEAYTNNLFSLALCALEMTLQPKEKISQIYKPAQIDLTFEQIKEHIDILRFEFN